MKKELLEWLKAFIVALVVVLTINIFVTPTTVFSISMNPTLVEGDVLLLQKSNNFKRGDIVSFKSDLVLRASDLEKLNPIQKIIAKKVPNKNLIKRIIGMPGDSILIENAEVFVNGEKLEEVYIGSETIGFTFIEEIPENQYFLMGDNRSHSTDSRSPLVGTISEDKIIGKSVLRLFPISKAGTVE